MMSEERPGEVPGEPEDDDLLDDELDLDTEEEEAEPEPVLETGDGAEPQPQPTEPERQPSRSERRIRALRERLKQTEEENRRYREQAFRPPQPQVPQVDPVRQAEADRLEAERVSLMSPQEIGQYYAQRAEQRMSQSLLREQLATRDMLDRQLFEGIKRDEPAAWRLSADIENALIAARQQGMNPSREQIYNLLVGQEVRAKAVRQTERQRRTAAQRVRSQTTNAGARGSNVASQRQQRRSDPDAGLDDRLRSVTIGDVW